MCDPVSIGVGVLGLGASAIAANEQSDAISDAQRAQDQGNAEALQYARETRDMQLGLAEPFRQFGIQQANFLGEIFGFNPVGQGGAYEPPTQGGGQTPTPLPGETDPRVAEQNRYAQYVNQNPDLIAEWEAFTGRPGGRSFGPNLPASYDLNGDGNLSVDEYGAFHFDRFGRGEGRELPGAGGEAAGATAPAMSGAPGAQTGPIEGGMIDPGPLSSAPGQQTGPITQGGMSNPGPLSGSPGQVSGPIEGGMISPEMSSTPGAQTGPIEGGLADPNDPNAINTEAQARARRRFNGSLFSDALNGQLADVATGIDANMAASGAVYSGARESAQGLARSRYGMSALNSYIGAGLGQPSTAGAQMAGNAAGQFGATAGSLAMAGGQTAANSAYARGDLTSNLAGNIANLGAYGLGAWSGGGNRGGGSAQASDFNLGYGRNYSSAFTG